MKFIQHENVLVNLAEVTSIEISYVDFIIRFYKCFPSTDSSNPGSTKYKEMICVAIFVCNDRNELANIILQIKNA